MITEITPKEKKVMVSYHLSTVQEQTKVYNRYLREQFLTGAFPEENMFLHMINVVESIYEETMELDRAIAAPSGYEDVYEYILLKKNRFGKENQYVRARVYPIMYHPAPGDIVTLPAFLLQSAAECDSRLKDPNNWEMEIVETLESKQYSYNWINPNKKDTLIPKNITIYGIVPVVRPIHGGEPFAFPGILINHYILLHPKKEEEYNVTSREA